MPFRTSRPARKRTARALLAAALLCGAFLLYVTGVYAPRVFSDGAHTLLRGLWSIEQKLRPAASVDVQVAALRAENMTLRRDLLMSRTGTTFGETEPGAQSVVLANVLTSTSLMPEDVFILDTGTQHGVQQGALVVDAEDGFAIGYVARVLTNSAVVHAFSSPHAEVRAVLRGQDQIHVDTVGKGSGTLEISLPRGVEIAEGDQLLLPGGAQLLLAYIAYIEPEPEAALVRGLARMYSTVPTTTRVFVYNTLVWRVTDAMLDGGEDAEATTTTDYAE